MKRLRGMKIAVKALSAVLIAGMLVTGVRIDASARVFYLSNGTPVDIEEQYVKDYDACGAYSDWDLMHALELQQLDQQAAAEAAAQAQAAAEAARQAEEARKAEAARQAEEARQAEAARQAEEARQAEAARQAEEARQAEAARQAEEARKAEEARQAEEARKAEEARQAAAQAQAEAEAKAAAEAKAKAEAEAKAAEEARLAARQKRPTPAAQFNAANKCLVNVPENSAISGNNGVNWAQCSGGTYTFDNAQFESIKAAVQAQGSLNILVKALGDNDTTLDSDVQTLAIKTSDFPQKTKRNAPTAAFDAASGVLSGLDYAKYSVDGGATWSAPASGSVTISGVHPDLEILVVNAARNDSEEDSASAQTIWISKAGKPNGVTANPPARIGGHGSIVNVSSEEEYCVSGSNAWTAITGNVVEVMPGTYDVRIKAKGTMLAGDPVTVTVSQQSGQKMPKPNATFDGASLNLYNINAGCAYTVDDTNWIDITGSVSSVTLTREQADKAVHGNGIRIVRRGDNVSTIDSDIQTISIAEAVRPSGVTTTPATNGNNGALNNVAKDMQYRPENGNWYDIGSNTITGLAPGKYYVRRRGFGTTIPSESLEVVIDRGSTSKQPTPNASFNAWNMTLSNVSGCAYSLDGGNGFSNKLDKNEVVLSEGDIKIGKGIQIVRCADGNVQASDVQTINLCKMDMPKGVSAYSATAKTGGMITGVNGYMEYRAATSGTWLVPTGNTIANLPAGTYYVRARGQHNAMPSDALTIVIQTSATQVVVQPSTSTIIVSPVANNTTPAKTENKTPAKTENKTETKTETKTEAKTETKTETKTEEGTGDGGFVIATEGGTAAEGSEQSTNAATGEPVLLADTSVQGWGAIEGRMSKESTEPIAVDLTNASTVVPATAIAAAASTDTELIIDVTPEAAWSIIPTEITSAREDIDLGIKFNTNDIPQEAISTVESDGKVAKKFTVNHDGDFGFVAHLTVKLDAADSGKTAKLYYYNKATGAMEEVSDATINSYGEATFALSHASSYAVTVKTASADTSVSTDNGTADTNKADVTTKTAEKKSGSTWWIWVIVFAVILTAAACAVVVYLKKKDEEARRKHHHSNQTGNGPKHN